MVNIPIVVGSRDGLSWARLREVRALWLIPAWIIWLVALIISSSAPDVLYPPLILALLLTAIPLIYFTYRYFIPWLRLRLFSKISRLIKYEIILTTGMETVYRNMDAQNILDAFEKGSGTFYMIYKEADEHLFYRETGDQRKVEKIRDIGSKMMEMFESMIRSLGTAIDFTTAMSAFFLARIEDELLDKSAFDQLKIRYKEMSPELQAVKDGEFDLPIWEPVVDLGKPPGEEKHQILFRNLRKVGLLVVVSGLDVPSRIIRDVETARRQHTILMRIKDMKSIKGLAEATTKMDKEFLDRISEELAYDAESIKRVESLVLRFEEPERLDQAIDLYFPDIPPTSRKIMVKEIEEAIERVVNEALASSITSLDEIKDKLSESLREALERCLPHNLIDRLVNQLEKILETSYIFRELGKYLAKKKEMWECSTDSLAEAAKRTGEYFLEELGRRTSTGFFDRVIEELGRDENSILRSIETSIEQIRDRIEGLSGESLRRLPERTIEELMNRLSRTGVEVSSVLRPLNQLLGGAEGISEREAREKLISIIGDESRAIRVLERLIRTRNSLADLSVAMERLLRSLERELWERRRIRGNQEESREESAGNDLEKPEERVTELRTDMERLVSMLGDLREILEIFSIPMEIVGNIMSRRDEYREKIELTMITKRALEYEIVKTLNSLARKDLRLFISSRLGNPLKELYIKWRERKIGWWA